MLFEKLREVIYLLPDIDVNVKDNG